MAWYDKSWFGLLMPEAASMLQEQRAAAQANESYLDQQDAEAKLAGTRSLRSGITWNQAPPPSGNISMPTYGTDPAGNMTTSRQRVPAAGLLEQPGQGGLLTNSTSPPTGVKPTQTLERILAASQPKPEQSRQSRPPAPMPPDPQQIPRAMQGIAQDRQQLLARANPKGFVAAQMQAMNPARDNYLIDGRRTMMLTMPEATALQAQGHTVAKAGNASADANLPQGMVGNKDGTVGYLPNFITSQADLKGAEVGAAQKAELPFVGPRAAAAGWATVGPDAAKAANQASIQAQHDLQEVTADGVTYFVPKSALLAQRQAVPQAKAPPVPTAPPAAQPRMPGPWLPNRAPVQAPAQGPSPQASQAPPGAVGVAREPTVGERFKLITGNELKPGWTAEVDQDGTVTGKALPPASEKAAAKEHVTNVLTQLKPVRTQIDNLKVNKDAVNSVVGSIQGRSWYPNTTFGLGGAGDRATAWSDLHALKNQMQVRGLQMMRDASKTGGAVGSVTEKEWPKLESMIANLDPTQDEKAFWKQVDQIEAAMADVEKTIRNTYRETYGEDLPSDGAGPTTEEVIQELRKRGVI